MCLIYCRNWFWLLHTFQRDEGCWEWDCSLPSLQGIWMLIVPSVDIRFQNFIASHCGPLVSATLEVIDVSLLWVQWSLSGLWKWSYWLHPLEGMTVLAVLSSPGFLCGLWSDESIFKWWEEIDTVLELPFSICGDQRLRNNPENLVFFSLLSFSETRFLLRGNTAHFSNINKGKNETPSWAHSSHCPLKLIFFFFLFSLSQFQFRLVMNLASTCAPAFDIASFFIFMLGLSGMQRSAWLCSVSFADIQQNNPRRM